MSAEKKTIEVSDLLVCPRCSGRASDGLRPCPACRGLGSGLPHAGLFLYWGRRVDGFTIRLAKLRGALDLAFDLLLGLTALGGLVLLLWLARLSQPADWFTWYFWELPHRHLLGFWTGALCACLLYYRRVAAAAKRGQVRKRERARPGRAAVEPEAILLASSWDWDRVAKLRRADRIDVARAYSREAGQAVDAAFLLARRLGHAEVRPVHVFGALLSTVKVSVMFGRLGLNFARFQDQVSRMLGQLPVDRQQTVISETVRLCLLEAYAEAFNKNQPEVGPLELFLAVFRRDASLQELLFDLGVDAAKIDNVVSWIRVNDLIVRRLRRFSSAAKNKPKTAMNRAMTAVATPYLDSISRDLTLAAAYGHFAPVIDRDPEFEAMFRIMEGGHRSLVIVGESGVGKETLIQGLAQMMVEEDVPAILQDRRLLRLDVAQLVSGASAAEAEERLLNALYEVARAGNIVLAVPDVAGMTGITAGSGDSMDLSRVFANELAKGYFFAITTATPREYSSAIENSPLGRSLVKLELPETDVNKAIRILEAKIGVIEYQNGVYFSYDAVEAAVTLADRYLNDKFLPEKGILMAREAAAAAKAARGANAVVGRDDVAGVISEKTHIPLKTLTEEESHKLLNLEARMHERIIGQEAAVRSVASAMRRARAELREQTRPIANFLFLGPTGVGKTELAKTLAEVYFGNEEAMIRLDMSEYQDKQSLYRLVGEPAGAQAGGILTEAVRKQPFSLILLDEIEKANPDILTVFLQVMDDGRLTDNMGRTVDFTNVILIATSNAGAQYLQDELRRGTAVAAVKEGLISRELKTYFRPEFLNRFDDIIVFSPLSQPEIEQIARLMLAKVAKRLNEKGIALEVTDAAVKDLAAAGFDPVFGARPLRRVIQDKVDNVIAEALLAGKLGRRDRIILDKDGAIRVEKAARL
ncbi:MAG: ATP-dependent Clp protease ATP-binding subunit [Patescibacteria group bacterium]|jgi:ATP-dependent Clp protease ATP-binding subunit ClpC